MTSVARPARRAGAPTVLGVGNPIAGDDGVGVQAARLLRERVPSSVRIVEAERVGLDLLPVVEEASELLVLDVIDAGKEPGEVVVVGSGDLSSWLRVSPHEIGITDLLALASLRRNAPGEVTLAGIQPARLDPGAGLSPEVAAAVPRLAAVAASIVGAWAPSPPAGGPTSE